MATWNDVVYRFWGPCSEQDAHDLLWGATAFPFADVRYTARQLRKKREQSKGDVNVALAIADEETEIAMQEIQEQDNG